MSDKPVGATNDASNTGKLFIQQLKRRSKEKVGLNGYNQAWVGLARSFLTCRLIGKTQMQHHNYIILYHGRKMVEKHTCGLPSIPPYRHGYVLLLIRLQLGA